MQFFQTLFSHDAWQLLGRFHVILIHFPVALLIAAAMVEAFAIVRRKSSPHPAAFACLLIGTLAAIVSATTGWAHADYTPFPDQVDTVFYHRWLGIASAVLGLVVLALHQRARAGSVASIRIYQVAAFITAAVVGFTGHLGGTLTHGSDFLTINPAAAPTTTLPAASLASFTQIQPILAKSCIECHGPAKQKSGLRVDSPDAILKGGKAGAAMIPGDSEHSLLIRRCRGLDNEPRMPYKRPALADDQVNFLSQWIDSLPRQK